jgi:hypothetical protein
MECLYAPAHLYTSAEVLACPCPVPATAGVYMWYFDEAPAGINTSGCHHVGDRTLLYVGISPKAPPANGRASSRSTLRQRIRTHYAGNAEGSTLRRTLGCLLGPRLGFQLRRVGSGTRYTFTNPGEQILDQWMAQHAFVTWIEIERPWALEAQILSSAVMLPLNLAGNMKLEAAPWLTSLRSAARRQADLLEIVVNNGGPRSKR